MATEKTPDIINSYQTAQSDTSSTITLPVQKETAITQPQQDEIEYPPARRVLTIMLGLFMVVFLVALDRTIIGTAIPTITNEFNSLNDVGWYASAYLITMCGFQLVIGRIYTFYDIKTVFLCNIVLFELGSALCGAAPNSTAFIIGRAIAGIGSGGIMGGAIPIFVNILPLEQRPKWTGLFGLVFGVASVVSPLLGGAFTDKVSWRWCFYINLPIGAVSFVIIIFVLQMPPQKRIELTTLQKLKRLDPLGFIMFFPGIICLLLALQWGGTKYDWSNARIIALLVLFALLTIGFCVLQVFHTENGTVPLHIIKNRNITGGMIVTLCNGSAMMVFVYFLPIWFQAIKGASAVKSGVMNLPMMAGVVVSSMAAGFATRKIGYYMQWIYAGAVIMPIGAGLMATFTTTTDHEKWIGYQFMFGFGLGICMQQPMLAAQTVLARIDVPSGVALMFFSQLLGGAIASSISNNIFDNKLATGLAKIPGLDIRSVLGVGATELRRIVPVSALPAVLRVYNTALVDAFYVGVALSSLLLLGAPLMQWKRIVDSQNASKPATPKGDQPKEQV